jgi:cytochrome c2
VRAKLENPRRFDRGKIKTWDEKLRMPNFHLNKQEITDLVTVIQGFSKARMDTDMRPAVTAQRAAIEEGRRIIRDHNCVACHIIGKQGGAIRAKIKDPGYFPPSLDGEGEKVIPVWLFNFLKGPTTVRPWLNVRMPTFGLNDHETVAISRMFANLDKAEYPFESEYFKLEPATPDLLAGGSKLFTDFKCLQCHFTEQGKTERDAADLAPNLSLARSRLRPAWIEKWLRDPQALQPGTRMPAYFPDMKSPDPQTLGGDAALQIKALKYHVLGLAPKTPPVTTGN